MFKVLHEDSKTYARLGRLELPHGVVETPVFMPVGTFGAVRGLSAWELESTEASMMLSNTFHLISRPGAEAVAQMGGLHSFNSWRKPILTDSGGFQVFSLSGFRKLTAEGVEFQDPIDGRRLFLSPESVVATQESWGVDIAMVLDVCPPAGADSKTMKQALELTHRWAERSLQAWSKNFLFPIVQGGTDLSSRKMSLETLLSFEKTVGKQWPGIAVGGMSVGEKKEDFYRILFEVRKILPKEKPHYLMGVGTPRDLVFGVACGIDMFDCVIPSRNARHGIVMTRKGRIDLGKSDWKLDTRPIEENCDCWTCQRYSRAFLRHLFQVQDSLGQRLATLHNVRYFIRLMKEIRQALSENRFAEYAHEFLRKEENIYLGGEKDFRGFPDSFAP